MSCKSLSSLLLNSSRLMLIILAGLCLSCVPPELLFKALSGKTAKTDSSIPNTPSAPADSFLVLYDSSDGVHLWSTGNRHDTLLLPTYLGEGYPLSDILQGDPADAQCQLILMRYRFHDSDHVSIIDVRGRSARHVIGYPYNDSITFSGAWSPDCQTLAISCQSADRVAERPNAGSRGGLFTFRRDGSLIRRIPVKVPVFIVDWLNNGNLVVSNPNNGNLDVSNNEERFRIVDTSDGHTIRSSSLIKTGRFVPSPDHRRIWYEKLIEVYVERFQREVDCAEVFVVDADGLKSKIIADYRVKAGWMKWSPDGRALALEVDPDYSGITHLGFYDFVIDSLRWFVERATDGASYSAGDPAWSPDGSRVAYARSSLWSDRSDPAASFAQTEIVVSGIKRRGFEGIDDSPRVVWRSEGPHSSQDFHRGTTNSATSKASVLYWIDAKTLLINTRDATRVVELSGKELLIFPEPSETQILLVRRA